MNGYNRGPKMTMKKNAISKMKDRMGELYSGDCREADELLMELEFNPHISTKVINLMSDALWELR